MFRIFLFFCFTYISTTWYELYSTRSCICNGWMSSFASHVEEVYPREEAPSVRSVSSSHPIARCRLASHHAWFTHPSPTSSTRGSSSGRRVTAKSSSATSSVSSSIPHRRIGDVTETLTWAKPAASRSPGRADAPARCAGAGLHINANPDRHKHSVRQRTTPSAAL